jgi:hypothetical protein
VVAVRAAACAFEILPTLSAFSEVVEIALSCVAVRPCAWVEVRDASCVEDRLVPMSVVEKSRMVPSTNRRSVGLSVRSNSLPSRVLQESAARISRIFDVMQLERAVP